MRKGHRALSIALRELLGVSGKLNRGTLRNFEEAMDLREEADYGLEFSEASSADIVEDAKKFLDMAKKTLGIR